MWKFSVDAWKRRDQDPTPKMINELKELLEKAEMAQWTVQPSASYQVALKRIRGATPPLKFELDDQLQKEVSVSSSSEPLTSLGRGND